MGRWGSAVVLFVLAVVTVAPSGMASSCEPRAAACHRGPLHVPRDFRTIQGAIDDAPDGSTIILDPGVYHQSFVVAGKSLRIIGADEAARTEIVSSGRDTGLATYLNSGGGELKNLTFRGGAYAVGGIRDGSLLPSSLSLKNLAISEGYRGIYGSFSNLDVKNVSISATQWHGISLTHLTGHTVLKNLDIGKAGGVGFYLLDDGPGDITIGGHFHHNLFGGVYIEGHTGAVKLLFVVADHNGPYPGHTGGFGVKLFDANVGMSLSGLTDHLDSPPGPDGNRVCGIGVLAVSSTATITGTYFRDDECAGVWNKMSQVSLGSNVFEVQPGGTTLAGSDPATSTWYDLGGNVCGSDLGTPDEFIIACQAKYPLGVLPDFSATP